MMKKKRTVWMNLLLIFALVAGLVFPASNVNAAGKQKKETKKVLVVYFSATKSKTWAEFCFECRKESEKGNGR